jgi:DNA polymerase-3 subunit chi
VLTDDAEQPLPHQQVLLNLSQRMTEHFARFERKVEIVSTDEEDLLAGRERY